MFASLVWSQCWRVASHPKGAVAPAYLPGVPTLALELMGECGRVVPPSCFLSSYPVVLARLLALSSQDGCLRCKAIQWEAGIPRRRPHPVVMNSTISQSDRCQWYLETAWLHARTRLQSIARPAPTALV